jgi:hypothetical protein
LLSERQALFYEKHMINGFFMNGIWWRVRFTNSNDPILVDRTNVLTVGVTDPESKTIYLSNKLSGGFLTRVVLHELSHAMMYSYNYLGQIHTFCKKKYWIEMEELIANLIADRAYEIFYRAYDIVGDEAIKFVPYEMERLIA